MFIQSIFILKSFSFTYNFLAFVLKIFIPNQSKNIFIYKIPNMNNISIRRISTGNNNYRFKMPVCSLVAGYLFTCIN